MATVSQGGFFTLTEHTSLGALAPNYRVYTYIAGTTTHKNAYIDQTGNTAHTYTSDGGGGQYIATNARGELPAPLYLTTGAYDITVKTDTGSTVRTRRIEPIVDYDLALRADLAASSGSSIVGFLQAGTGAVARLMQDKARERVSIVDYGGAAGAGDNTAAMDAAELYLHNTFGGGTIEIPYAGEWRMNFVHKYRNITIEGQGGNAEFDLQCIRPYSLASAALTVGDGTSADLYYCGWKHLHVSGSDGTANGVTNAANNAPHCVRLRGGAIKFKAIDCQFYNGLKTISEEPSATQPVTENTFLNCGWRNDITNSASARGMYIVRLADPGYHTDNKHINLKGNLAPGNLGYAAEIDGNGASLEISDSYWDFPAAHGITLKNSGTIRGGGAGFYLDPGASDVEIIKKDDTAKDPTRWLVGRILTGSTQRVVFSDASYINLLGEGGSYVYRGIMRDMRLLGPLYWTWTGDPMGTGSSIQRQDSDGVSGPLMLNNGVGDGTRTENAASIIRGQVSEEITLSTVGLTTDSAGYLLPANSMIDAVVCRITQTITTTTNWAVGTNVVAARFSAANATKTAGTTSVGTDHQDQVGLGIGPRQDINAPIRITCTGANPGAGKIRVTTFYRQFVAPTS